MKINKTTPKILHILTSKAWGGLELYVVSLIKKQLDAGFFSVLYCLPNTKVSKNAEKLGIPIFFGIRQSRFSIKDIKQVINLTKIEKFTVLHSHSRQDVWLSSLAKIFVPHLKHIFSLYMSAPRKKDVLHKFIYRKIDAITSSSEKLNEEIKKNFPVNSSSVYLIRYGIDHPHCDKNNNESIFTRALLHTPTDHCVFLCMSRLDVAKGVREFAEGFSLLKDTTKQKVSFWLMGEPTLLYMDEHGKLEYEKQSLEVYQWLQNYAKMYPDNFKLISYQKNPRPYLEAANVFVLPTYKETYSLGVIEAMALGLPVIGTNSGGTSEQVISGERGYLIESRSASAIAEAVEFYVNNKNEIEAQGQRAKKWSTATHSWENSLNQLASLYSME